MAAEGEPKQARPGRCLAMPGGKPCANKPSPGLPYCRKHAGPLAPKRDLTSREFLDEWRGSAERAVSRRVNRKPLKANYDEDLVRTLLPFASPLYRLYWRAALEGVGSIPNEVPARRRCTHTGSLPPGAAILEGAVLR